MQFIPGPDFPTAGIINGSQEIAHAYRTGRGRIYVRARTEIEEDDKGRAGHHHHRAAVPGEQGAADRAHRRAGAREDHRGHRAMPARRVRQGRHARRHRAQARRIADIVLNNLYKHTPMESVFGINMVALQDGQPKLLNLKEMLERSCAIAAKSSRGARSSTCARRASVPTSSKAWPSRSRTSTRSSRSSRLRRRRPKRRSR